MDLILYVVGYTEILIGIVWALSISHLAAVLGHMTGKWVPNTRLFLLTAVLVVVHL